MIKLNDIQKILNPIKRGLRIMLSKGVVTKIQSNEAGESQKVQVDLGNDQVLDNIERVQPYGLSSFPEGEAETILISLAGNRDHSIVLQVDSNKYRLKVEEGNVRLYNSKGINIHLKEEEILLGQNDPVLIPLDGVITGQAVDTLTGIPLGALPGGNNLGTANSQKLKVEL